MSNPTTLANFSFDGCRQQSDPAHKTRSMLTTEQDDASYRVYYRSYRLALALLILPPLMLIEYTPAVLDASIDRSEIAALLLGILLPLAGAWYSLEFASFSFSLRDDCFRSRWRKLLRQESLEIPLQRVVRVQRETVETGDSSGAQYRFRLVVVLDDDSTVGLTRSYSSLHARKLKLIVEQIREYLGHVVPMR